MGGHSPRGWRGPVSHISAGIASSGRYIATAAAPVSMATVSARSVSEKTHTPVNTTSKSDNHLRE